MQSVSIEIHGAFWDSQIYSGELILFDWHGALHRLDWREIINNIAEQHSGVQTALRVAFSDSDLFYNPKVRKILYDPAIAGPIKDQLRQLAELSIYPNTEGPFRSVQESPFDFLSADTEIYYGQIFACGDEGLYSAPRQSIGPDMFQKRRAVKCHDAPFQQIKASDRHTAIAGAAGDDGLFEFPFSKDIDGFLNKGQQLVPRSCNACEWSFQNVIGWTGGNAFLASFREEKETRTNKYLRYFNRIIESREMFGDTLDGASSFTWGSREKMYRLSNRGIEVMNYIPATKRSSKIGQEGQYKFLGTSDSSDEIPLVGLPVATSTAPFGTIIEYEDHITVIRSDGKLEQFNGEAVHWRIFPRSDLYSNQLHIIYDDRLLIVSFVHDYFVNQSDKLFGFSRAAATTEKDTSSTFI
jgi:hypothetical protein